MEIKAQGSTHDAQRGPRQRKSQGRDVDISKALSRLLRHQAENAGINLDKEGFAPLDKVLQWGPLKALGVSVEEVEAIVETNAKKRFALKPIAQGDPASPASYLIRANQGHSLQVDPASLFRSIALGDADFPARVLHGTYFAFWDDIVRSGGLKPMTRGHIHCSEKTLEEGAVSGMRGDAEILVEIDIQASLEEGAAWWRSENGVILTDGGSEGLLSTRFFKKVTGRKAGVGVLWEDGEKRADLPVGLKMVVPAGKRGARGRVRGRGRGRGGGRGGGEERGGRGGTGGVV
ncbi:uncharacterized protein UV8b_03671 [Ustilaginoidea virens]|uniref:2'-phosphotransferase n=1 Tax=Ustilaginoidea virens TaxID=1159556 RepID=A0A8E5HPS4_USTVR|nr:uncharacterized protein UV8b_03671 [Ustilaginoidea virens]QUC19430.1 hypothetical protein UV8b_03671 [Ustilaginoidea virens]